MPSVIQASVGQILLATKGQLVAQLPYLTKSPTLAIITTKDDVPQLQEGQDVVLRLGSFISRADDYDGSGRECTRFKRYLIVYPRVRLSLDEVDRDEQFLTNSSLGFSVWEESCSDCLIGFWPMDLAGNFITPMELRLSQGTDPVRAKLDQMWGASAVTFEFDYLFSLNGSRKWRPPLITTTTAGPATVNIAYSQLFTCISPDIGGTGPYSWAVPYGGLPTGMDMSAGGALQGTPTVAGTFPFTVVLTDTNGQRGAQQIVLVVN